MKIKTLTQLQDALDADLSWRKKEILYLRTQAKSSSPNILKTIIRSGVALLYAHWEGFIKCTSLAYISYVNAQGHKFKDLNSNFIVLGVKGKLSILGESKKSQTNRQIIDFLLAGLGERASLNLTSAIDTESNLSSQVFENIATTLDMDTTAYSTKYNLIDKSLVYRRNHIVHGEYLDLKMKDWEELVDEIMEIMEWFKTDVLNLASTKKFMRT